MWLQTHFFLYWTVYKHWYSSYANSTPKICINFYWPSFNKCRFCFCYLPKGECLSTVHRTYSLHFNVGNKDWAIVSTLFSAMYYFYGAIPFPHISHAKRGSSLPLFSLGNCGKRWKVSEPSKPYIPAKKWRKPVRI